MKKYILVFISLAFLTFIRCSMDALSGTTSSENAKVLGLIVTENGDVASNTIVEIIPNDYNPLIDELSGGLLRDTTDNEGKFEFLLSKSGIYNIQAVHLYQRTRLLNRGIVVDTREDIIQVPDGMLREPGAAKIELPDTVDTLTSYLYLPGTILYQKLSEETLFHVNNTIHVIFDSIPAGNTPGIYFGKEDSLFYTIPLTDAFKVTSNDTVNLTIQVEWLSYTTANSGLPNDGIASVMTDDAGMLWVGTNMNGLATFDGTTWTVYTRQNSQLPSNSIQALAHEADGTIWIGTTGGVVSIQNALWQVYTTLNSNLPSNYISSIAEDSSGNIWFGTNNGCAEFDGTNWNHHTGSQPLIIGAVNAMAVDKQGLVLAGTGDGLYTYDKLQWRNIRVSETEFMYNDIEDIAIDNNNTGWFATSNGMVSYQNGECTIHDSLGLNFFSSKLQSIEVDWNNIVWAGSFFEGTVAKCSNPVVLYNEDNTDIFKNVIRINDIDAHTEHTIFFATDYNGIILLQFTYVYK